MYSVETINTWTATVSLWIVKVGEQITRIAQASKTRGNWGKGRRKSPSLPRLALLLLTR